MHHPKRIHHLSDNHLICPSRNSYETITFNRQCGVSCCRRTSQCCQHHGAGATFPQPVYSKWAGAYQKATGNQINYQGIGSSGGIKQIKQKRLISVPLMRQ
ncbi:MAG: substrate-binding domain-containing protein [Moraxella osloensis]